MLLTHALTIAVHLPLLMMPNFKLLTEVRLNSKKSMKEMLAFNTNKLQKFCLNSN